MRNDFKVAAKLFADEWYGRGDEKNDTQKFWTTLLRDVFGVEKPENLIEFEIPVANGSIDAYISRTRVLIEQKSYDMELTHEVFAQAKRYAENLPESPRWIVTCNFSEFRIYKAGRDEPTIIKLRDLRYQYERLRFLIDPNSDDSPPEEKISKEALEVISKIYDAFAKNYQRNKVGDYEDALNKICTRLVFCLYAGDAHIFKANQFFDYLQSFSDAERNEALQNLFEVLNTPEPLRGDISDELKNFPYVNGGLFDEKISLPDYNKNVGNPTASIGTFNARKKFSWHEISPPIFGAMFESTFSRENKQRSSGMFYTSVENIHKVIDPLFMEDLRGEFEAIKRKQLKNRATALLDLQNKISQLKFLDPACGSGNFLTETYLSIRRLENEILEELRPLVTLPDNPIKVSIQNFYGIEINGFAVAVAQTALWIAENQMLQETEGALGKNLQALPLKNLATIVKANALRADWKEICPRADFIIGNPPFVGARLKSAEQASDIKKIFAGWKNLGNLDYVCCWYKKATDIMADSTTKTALVSTNSVCQGESIGALWKNLNVHIDFAHRTFKWLSDSENKASVHCVVVGFSRAPNSKPKLIYDGEKVTIAQNINAYLVDGEDIFVESTPSHIQAGVPKMIFGSMPNDGGNLIIEVEDLDYFLRNEPAAKKYIHLYVGAREFINDRKRYCLWLEGVPLSEIEKMPHVLERVEKVREHRLKSKREVTHKFAETPMLFAEIRQPKTNYILIPGASSERRKYIPIGFMSPDVIASDAVLTIPDAELYHFGVLTSSIHMAWMRAVAGRLEISYSYSIKIVYNNFIWCTPSAELREMIRESAQKILDVRKKYPDWTLAKLYDDVTMPNKLRLAHKSNDYAVALAYGFEKFLDDESKIVSELMKLYKRIKDKG